MSPRALRWTTALVCSALLLAVSVVVGVVLRLGRPAGLGWAAFSVVMPLLYATWEDWRQRMASLLGSPSSIHSLVEGGSAHIRVARAALLTLAAWLLAVAFAQPQWGERPREIQRRGIDIVFALDLSRSMYATDLAPDRLQAVVSQLTSYLRRLDGDRVGLVVFAADAVVQSPLTSDYGAIRHYLDRASPEHFDRQGTAVGRAIERSTRLLLGGDDGAFRRAQTQLIIVLSDGEDTVTRPIEAAANAQAEGIHVYTVGVGTPEGATIPLRSANGTITQYLTDRNGQTVTSRLVEQQLIETSRAGGGEYLRLGQQGTLEAFLDAAIEQYEDEVLSSLLRLQYEERFEFFAIPAFLMLLVATSLRDRRRRSWTPEATAAIAMLMLVGGCDDGLFEREDPWVNRAIELASADAGEQAQQALERVGEETRTRPGFAYASGWVNEQALAYAEAQRAYLQALSEDDTAAQVQALTALANVLVARDELDAAIERYRRALVLDPACEPARRNLEIALMRRFPACSTLDTVQEPNDAADAALDLPSSVYQGDYMPPGVQPSGEGTSEEVTFTVCPGNADWYRIPALPGATLDVTARFTRLRDDNGGPPPPEFISPTDVRIAIIGPQPEDVLGVDQGLTESGVNVRGQTLRRTMNDVEIPVNYTENTPVYLKVEANIPLEYTYTLEITVTPPCYALDDEFEANDIRSTARAMDPGEHSAFTCPANDDWYMFNWNPQQSMFVEFSPAVARDGQALPLTVEWYMNEDSEPFRTDTLSAETGLAEFQHWSPFDLAVVNAVPGQAAAPVDPAQLAEQPSSRLFARVVNANADFQGGYELGVYRFDPCPAGDDRYEPNDQPDARTQFAQEDTPPYRYLRFCDANQDWFEVVVPPASEDEEAAEGSGSPPSDGSRPFSALVQALQPNQALDGALVSPTTGQRVAGFDISQSADPTAPASWLSVFQVPSETSSMVVGLVGTTGYYHLSFPELEQQQQQQQQQEQQEQQQADQQENQEESEPQDDSEGSGDPAEPQEDSPEEGSSEPPQPEEGSSQPSEPEEGSDSQAPAQPEQVSDEELSRQQLMQLLDSLEGDDVNLQVEQATRGLPAQRFEQEW